MKALRTFGKLLYAALSKAWTKMQESHARALRIEREFEAAKERNRMKYYYFRGDLL